jgi:hypothetical protein
MERLELQLSPQEKELVWKAVDLNSDGHLNYLEFCAAFQVSWGVVCLVFFSPFGILCGVSGLLAVWFFGVVYTHWLARARTHTHTHTHTHTQGGGYLGLFQQCCARDNGGGAVGSAGTFRF